MIDLHCHVLPGIDDGPADMETSLLMARAALAEGIHTIVATPHFNLRYDAEPDAIAAGIDELRAALARDELSLTVLGGAEIAFSRLAGLEPRELSDLCLGHSSYLLVESPYTTAGSLIEESIFDLEVRGFHPLLAHPERCPEFQRDLPRLERLVGRGAACSISAGSLNGQFGETVRRFAFRLVERGLAHNVSTDAHDPVRRPPRLRSAFRAQRNPVLGSDLQTWLTFTVPAAILADESLPPRPQISAPSRSRRWTSRGSRGYD